MIQLVKFILQEAQKNSISVREGFQRPKEEELETIDEQVFSVKLIDYQDTLLNSDK